MNTPAPRNNGTTCATCPSVQINPGRPTGPVVYPGSFDPPTFGHLDIITRAAGLFGRVIVAIGHNPVKSGFLPVETRLALLEELTRDLPGVEIRAYDGLTGDFAESVGAVAMIRGVRDAHDLAAEMQLATANRAVKGIETLLLPSDAATLAVSSSLIRQIAAAGGEVSAFAPPLVCRAIADIARKGPPQD